MSCTIKDNDIELTRGDTMILAVKMIKDGQEYTPTAGDVVRFAVKRNYSDKEPLILKDIPIETMLLRLDPEDTKNLAFATYQYDIEITFDDGVVDTFIAKKKFKLTEEVH